MALLKILEFPDPRLRTVARPVETFDSALQALIDDMFETMYEADGIGLAATQVDVHRRLMVMDLSEERDQPLVFINPEVLWASEEQVECEEGCLSVPGVYDAVTRPERVRVRAFDVQGQPFERECSGLLAVCIQHEMDHRAAAELERVGLQHRQVDSVHLLSYGERRQLELALALASRPRAPFLDEPCSGLSPSERQRIFNIITQLPRDITIVCIEHDMQVALGLADQVSVLHRGRLILEGTPDEVKLNPEVREVYLGKV